jgi:hypothetical protein
MDLAEKLLNTEYGKYLMEIALEKTVDITRMEDV